MQHRFVSYWPAMGNPRAPRLGAPANAKPSSSFSVKGSRACRRAAVARKSITAQSLVSFPGRDMAVCACREPRPRPFRLCGRKLRSSSGAQSTFQELTLQALTSPTNECRGCHSAKSSFSAGEAQSKGLYRSAFSSTPSGQKTGRPSCRGAESSFELLQRLYVGFQKLRVLPARIRHQLPPRPWRVYFGLQGNTLHQIKLYRGSDQCVRRIYRSVFLFTTDFAYWQMSILEPCWIRT